MSERPSTVSGRRTGLAALGVGLLAAVCCAGPVLVAAGALGLVGDVLGDPLVLWVAAIVLLTTVSTVLHRRRAGADHVAPNATSTAGTEGSAGKSDVTTTTHGRG